MRTIAQTRYGKIQGGDEGGVVVFRGVPYARPPVGELRFRAPRPLESWPDIREALEFADAAPQLGAGSRTGRCPPRRDPSPALQV